MTRKFAISDIHGCNHAFDALLDKIAFSKSDELYLLGDYIDRGSETKEVIQRILDLQAGGYAVRCLRGNHEQMFLDAFDDPAALRMWRDNGGIQMLDSYGVRYLEDIAETHLNFIKNLEWYFEVDAFILVHAGLDWSYPLQPLADKSKLIWSRYWQSKIDYEWLGQRCIIHGHTPQTRETITEQWRTLPEKRWIDIDAGCFIKADMNPNFGYLCAFDMSNRSLYFQENTWY